MVVFPDVAERAGDLDIFHRLHVGAPPQNNPLRRNPRNFRGSFFAIHQTLQQGGALVTHSLKVVHHTGERHGHGVAEEFVVVHAGDRDLLGNGNSEFLTNTQHIRRRAVVVAKNRHGLWQRGQLLRDPGEVFRPVALPLQVLEFMQRGQVGESETLRRDGLGKTLAPFVVDRVVREWKPREVPVAPLQEMPRRHRADGVVVALHARNREVRAGVRQLHARAMRFANKVRQFLPIAHMRNDSVAFPPTGNRRRVEGVRREMPVVLARKAGHSSIKAMVRRCDGEEDIPFQHRFYLAQNKTF